MGEQSAALQDPSRASEPARYGIAIDYSGGNQDLATYGRAVYVSTSGDLKVDLVGGSTLTFASLPVGWHPIAVKKIYQTGSTAAGIVVW